MSYLSFEEAVKAVATLAQKPATKVDYFRLYKQRDDLPKYPDKKYKAQWQGWRYFLGTVKVEKYDTLDEAKAAVLELNPIPSGFTNYRKVYRQDPKLPANPEDKYRLTGWRSWPDFIGKTVTSESDSTSEYYKTYSLAKLALRKVGIPDNKLAYNYKTTLDLKLPPEPEKHYKGCGWNGWDKFLSDTFYSSLEHAMAAVQKLYIVPITRDQYRSQYRYDPQLPREPDKFYSASWRGWKHYLRTKQFSNEKFNAKRIKTQRLINGNPIKPTEQKMEEKGELKIYDTVQIKEDVASLSNGWSLPKGMLGKVLEIENGIVMIGCDVADDDYAHVKSEYLTLAKKPLFSFTEIFNKIRHDLKNKGHGYSSFSDIVSEAYEESYYFNNNIDEDDFHVLNVTPVMLIYLFDMLPFEIKRLAVDNKAADIENWDFTDAVITELESPKNWQYLARLKSMEGRKT